LVYRQPIINGDNLPRVVEENADLIEAVLAIVADKERLHTIGA
jgi:hypothetical protein